MLSAVVLWRPVCVCVCVSMFFLLNVVCAMKVQNDRPSSAVRLRATSYRYTWINSARHTRTLLAQSTVVVRVMRCLGMLMLCRVSQVWLLVFGGGDVVKTVLFLRWPLKVRDAGARWWVRRCGGHGVGRLPDQPVPRDTHQQEVRGVFLPLVRSHFLCFFSYIVETPIRPPM